MPSPTLWHEAQRAGSAVNVAADFYKAGAKDAGAGLVTTGPYRLAIRINYFGGLALHAKKAALPRVHVLPLASADTLSAAGDIIRYGSFALCSGRWVSIMLPFWVIVSTWGSLTYVQLKSQQERYGAAFDSYASKTPLLVPYTVPAKPARNGADGGTAAKSK